MGFARNIRIYIYIYYDGPCQPFGCQQSLYLLVADETVCCQTVLCDYYPTPLMYIYISNTYISAFGGGTVEVVKHGKASSVREREREEIGSRANDVHSARALPTYIYIYTVYVRVGVFMSFCRTPPISSSIRVTTGICVSVCAAKRKEIKPKWPRRRIPVPTRWRRR